MEPKTSHRKLKEITIVLIHMIPCFLINGCIPIFYPYATTNPPPFNCIFDKEIKGMRAIAVDRHLKSGGDLIEANSISELARKIGFPEEMVKKTVEEFNSRVTRDHRALNASPPKGKERATAFKIKHPPFYAIYPVFAALNHTTGGPLIDEKTRVLGMNEQPIEGLYAAGSLAFGFMDGLYHIVEAVSGLELSVTLGRMAGKNVAMFAKSYEGKI